MLMISGQCEELLSRHRLLLASSLTLYDFTSSCTPRLSFEERQGNTALFRSCADYPDKFRQLNTAAKGGRGGGRRGAAAQEYFEFQVSWLFSHAWLSSFFLLSLLLPVFVCFPFCSPPHYDPFLLDFLRTTKSSSRTLATSSSSRTPLPPHLSLHCGRRWSLLPLPVRDSKSSSRSSWCSGIVG